MGGGGWRGEGKGYFSKGQHFLMPHPTSYRIYGDDDDNDNDDNNENENENNP